MKRLYLSITLAIMAILLVIMPVLAACYAYIYVEESDGNSYEELPLICSANITPLVESGFISSTGLDTRVITGDGVTLPHMLANDKIMFVSDLAAYEDKTLIFYPGASSLSSFPIIVGHNGSITTEDDPDLELGYVIELLASGYFDVSTGADRNILYKEDAFGMWTSGDDTICVYAFNETGDEQWGLSYDNFTTGEHTVYVLGNGLGAYLYVDDFDVAKDTVDLFDSNTVQTHSGQDTPEVKCFYAAGRYWVLYYLDVTHFAYKTSTDGGVSWSSESTIDIADAAGGEEMGSSSYWDAKFRDGYLHITYGGEYPDDSDKLRYRRGAPQSDGTITWSAAWQTAMSYGTTGGYRFERGWVAIDSDGYPTIAFDWLRNWKVRTYIVSSSSNDGTFTSTEEWEVFDDDHHIIDLTHFPNSNELAIIAQDDDNYKRWLRYYNGASWEAAEDISSYVSNFQSDGMASMTADSDGNLYVGRGFTTNWLAIRYATGVWDKVQVGTVDDSPHGGIMLCYNENNGIVYLLSVDDSGTPYVVAHAFNTNTMEFSSSHIITTLEGYRVHGLPPYGGSAVGFAMVDVAPDNTFHTYLDFTSYTWNDNSNNWTWMQNNVMSYADYLILGVDGEVQLEYQPSSIIQGTTLPDEENSHDGTINWGSNPDGVDVSHAELMCEEDEGESGYYHFEPGSQDIIKPEPEAMTGGIDLESLRGHPLYPFVQVLSIDGFLTERLVWIGLAWLSVIIAMFLVHIGPDTHRGNNRPQHFILTAITGLGLSIIWYSATVFPWWVLVLMGFGLIAAIIWERQPVI